MKIKIDLERDNNLTPFGIATVQDRYLDKNETSPQHAFARASKYVSTYQSDNNLSYVTIKIAVSVESKTKSKVRMQGRYLLDQCATGMRNTM